MKIMYDTRLMSRYRYWYTSLMYINNMMLLTMKVTIDFLNISPCKIRQAKKWHPKVVDRIRSKKTFTNYSKCYNIT